MNKKIFQTVFVSILITLILTLAVSSAVFFGEYESRVEADLSAELRLLASAVSSIDELDSVPGHRVTLIAQNGDVIYESERNPDDMENHFLRPEVQDALIYGYGTATRRSSTLLRSYHYAAARLDDGSVLRLAVNADTLLSFALDMVLPMVGILLFLIFFFAWFSMRAARRITNPINTIDLEHPDQNDVYEELSPLLFRIAKQQATIQKQLESAERRSREFSIITDSMSEGLVVIDNEMRILSVNKAAFRLFDAKEVHPGDSILAINRSDEFSEAVADALSGKRAECIITNKARTLQIIASPVFELSAASGGVVIIMDITEKAERERLRREFTANVSHELKTPLTSISGFAELLKNGGVPEETVKDFGSDIYSESQHLIALVHDIIRLSKLDEGNGEETLEMISLSSVASEAVSRLKKRAESLGVALRFEKMDEGMIMGSETLADELVSNLADNALKYNKAGGEAVVTVSKEADSIILSVKDNGIGIPEEDQARVFERFYRVDKSRSRASGGTGLGLSIVRHSAAAMHGTISLYSKLDEGTEVRVSFPKA